MKPEKLIRFWLLFLLFKKTFLFACGGYCKKYLANTALKTKINTTVILMDDVKTSLRPPINRVVKLI